VLNLIITGVGGQGTVLLSRLIGAAAIRKGFDVRGSETIGMAQRGGSVVSHVRLGQEIRAPLIAPGQANLIIAFEPGEAVRSLPYLAEDGALVVFDRAVSSVMYALGDIDYQGSEMVSYLRERVKKIVVVDGEALIADCGGAKAVNVALLGVAVGHGLLPFDKDDVEQAIKERVPERFWEMNLNALNKGKSL
jgi:indolepyruvate ferredoxin oxidoreductase beta subunit